MYHVVARFTQPCQVRNFVDSFNGKFIVYMVTMFGNIFRKDFATAFAFTFVPVIGVLAVHKILKVVFSVGVYGQSNILRSIDGRTVTRQGFMFGAIIYIPSASVCRVRGHFLVERSAFVVAVGYESHCNAEPLPLNFNCKCCAVISFMPVREIAERFQRNLHLVVLFVEGLFPDSQCRMIHPAVDCVKGMGTNRWLDILCDSHDNGVYILDLCRLGIVFSRTSRFFVLLLRDFVFSHRDVPYPGKVCLPDTVSRFWGQGFCACALL